MSFEITKTDLFEELSAEQQELLAGGRREVEEEEEPSFGGEEPSFGGEDQGGSGNGDTERRVRRIPIRLTGVLEVIK